MNICFVCGEYPPALHGGIGTVTQFLARNLVRRGHSVRVVGIYAPSYGRMQHSTDQGVEVVRLPEPAGRGGWIRARLTLLSTIRDWIRSGHADIVEVPDWQGWAALWPRLSIPVVARFQGSGTYFAAEMGRAIGHTARLLERASLQRADFWCSSSNYTDIKTRQLFRLNRAPSAILHNGVELQAISEFRLRSKTKIIFSGTLTRKKGIVSLIRAWNRVVRHRSDAELHIFGKDGLNDDGHSMRNYLETLMPLEVRRSVHFYGHVDRSVLFSELQTARVAVLPSYAEAFALAPLEAMAAGCPTIYTNKGSGPETLEHGREGLLVDPDVPDEIADSILAVLDDDRLAEGLGRAGWERIRQSFSADTNVSQNVQFYEECIRCFERGAQ